MSQKGSLSASVRPPLGLEVVDQPDEAPATVLTEEFCPDVAYIELGWNAVGVFVALWYSVANAAEPQSQMFRMGAVDLVHGHVQSRFLVGVDRDALQRFLESQPPHHDGVDFLVNLQCPCHELGRYR